MIKVGQRVRCRDGGGIVGPHALGDCPIEGMVYTVRGIVPSACGHNGLHLREILNRRRWFKEGFCEPAFGEWRFELVEEREVAKLRRLQIVTPLHEAALALRDKLRDFVQ